MTAAATVKVVGSRVSHSKKQSKWTCVLALLVAVSLVGQGILFFVLEREQSSSKQSRLIRTTKSWINRHRGVVSASQPDGHHRGQKNKDRVRSINSTAASASTDPVYSEEDFNKNHVDIVFTTDCSGYQHWQGILLYYSAQRVNHTGKVTRIASGCTLQQQMELKREWQRIDATRSKFQIHFAPSFALKDGKYKYSNKPGGLLHWLEHGQDQPSSQYGFNHDNNQRVIALLDPDMILLRPLTGNLLPTEGPSTTTTAKGGTSTWTNRSHGTNQIEYVDQQGMARLLRVKSLVSSQQEALFVPRVTTGHPAGQHFGVGGEWVQGGTPSAKPAWSNFNKSYVCSSSGSSEPCTNTSIHDARTKYAVGPVYLATFADWRRIATTWWDFVPRVHEQYPNLLAEMYALTMAVANLQLHFILASNYMITGASVTSPTEAWSWIDDLLLDNPQKACLGAEATTVPTWTVQIALPTTLHYCQNYRLSVHASSRRSDRSPDDTLLFFAKRKIPHHFFSCDGSPLPFPISDILDVLAQENLSREQIRTAFALCQVIPTLG